MMMSGEKPSEGTDPSRPEQGSAEEAVPPDPSRAVFAWLGVKTIIASDLGEAVSTIIYTKTASVLGEALYKTISGRLVGEALSTPF
jgi:hypothetical protein